MAKLMSAVMAGIQLPLLLRLPLLIVCDDPHTGHFIANMIAYFLTFLKTCKDSALQKILFCNLAYRIHFCLL